MEKIRNVLNPGAKHDDEILYGPGQSTKGTTGMTGASTLTDPTTSTANTSTNPMSSSAGLQADDAASTTAIHGGVLGQSTGETGTSGFGRDTTNTTRAGGSTLTGSELPDRSVGNSGYGNTNTTDTEALGSNTGRSFPLSGGNTSTTTGTATGGYGTETNTPGMETSSSHLGRDTALGAGAVGGAGIAEHERNRGLGGDTTNTTSSGLGSTTGTGIGSTTGSGVGSGSVGGPADWEHDHNRHGHEYTGDPCGPNETPAAPHFTQGPHVTDTANRLDPTVAEGFGGASAGAATEGHHKHHHHHKERDAALGTAGVGAGAGAYEAERHDEPRSSTLGESGMTTGTTAGTATGHHHKERDAALGATGVGAGAAAYEADKHRNEPTSSRSGESETTSGTATRHHDHKERDAALGTAGVGAGAAAYEAGKHHNQSTASAVDPSEPDTELTGPVHKSSLLNKLDPRVKAVPKSNYDELAPTPGGAANPEAYPPVDEQPNQNQGHHFGRDAAGGAALGGAAYEAEKHHHKKDDNLAGTIDRTDQPNTSAVDSNTGKQHHFGRDAAGGAALGGVAYEAEKHHDRDTAPLAGQPGPDSRLGTRGQEVGPATRAAGGHTYLSKRDESSPLGAPAGTSTTNTTATGKDHHYGRDAAGGAVLGGAVYEAEKHHDRDSTLAGTTAGTETGHGHALHGLSGQTHTGGMMGVGDSGYDKEVIDPANTTTAPPSAYTQALGTEGTRGQHVLGSPDNIRGINDPEAVSATGQHHKQEEEALAGAGAIGGAAISDKEAHKLEKQHDKELRKEEKQHDKEVRKEEKQHDKELKKEEKYEEKHDGKKSGGILGFLKKDKSDKDVKGEEAARQGPSTTNTYAPEAGAAVAGAGVAEYETGHHERNRLHKDPPESLLRERAAQANQTQYAEAPTTGYASQVTGGTGTTALAQGSNVPQGSHLTGLGNRLDPNVDDRLTNVDPERTQGGL
ncbi:MAG: hypothetical protein MMC33_002102 [Icmadophila ericetorum]|nr:hypothetical protein [Icmadophila ericetorum]